MKTSLYQTRPNRYLVALAAALVLLGGLSARAATVTFSPPAFCAADTDVLAPTSTGGTLASAYTWATNGATASFTVNGVAFTATAATNATIGNFNLSASGFTGRNGVAFWINTAPFNALSAAYTNLLRGAVFRAAGAATGTITLTGLTVGNTYLLELWVSDPRVQTVARTENFSSGGGNTVALRYNSAGTAGGGVGQYTFATFTADGTTQALTLQTTLSTDSLQLNAIQLQDITRTAASVVWKGNDGTNPNNWDMNVAANFDNGGSAKFQILDSVMFDDTASSFTPNAIGNLIPASVTFANSSAQPYTLGGSGSILGTGGLTKTGDGTVTITSTHNFSGAVAINGGTVSVASVTNGSIRSPLGAGTNITFDGGTLRFTGPASSMNRGITLNANGGTFQIDNTLTLSNALNGAGALTKSGAGTLTLPSANTYGGVTFISAGTLTMGANGSIASTSITNNGTFNVSAVTGGYHLTSGKTLFGLGSVTGPMAVDSGATITIGGAAGTTTGVLNHSGNLTLNGTEVLRIRQADGTNDIRF